MLWLVLSCFLFLNIVGAYIDKKCPFTGTVSIRGRILAGTCHSAKMQRTIIVRRNYLHFVKKYQRWQKIFTFVCFEFHLSVFNIDESIGMRKGIRTFLLMSHRVSVSKKEIMWSSGNAGEDSNELSVTIWNPCANIEYHWLKMLFQTVVKDGEV